MGTGVEPAITNALSEPSTTLTTSPNNSNNTALKSSLSNILFQIAGEIGAQNLDDAETQEGVSRMQNLVIAKQMEIEVDYPPKIDGRHTCLLPL